MMLARSLLAGAALALCAVAALAQSVTTSAPAPARSALVAFNAGGLNQTASTSLVMMGIKGAITPRTSGNIIIHIAGEWANSADTCSAIAAYGTGAAPNNGVAATGTVSGVTVRTQLNSWNALGIMTYVTGLTVGTAYWFDGQFKTLTTGPCILGAVAAHATEL